MKMTLNQQVIYALEHPYDAVLLPSFGQKKRVNNLIKQFILLKGNDSQKYLHKIKAKLAGIKTTDSIEKDTRTLEILGQAIVEMANSKATYSAMAHYYGLKYRDVEAGDSPILAREKANERSKAISLVQQNALLPLKSSFNRLGEYHRDKHTLQDRDVPRVSFKGQAGPANSEELAFEKEGKSRYVELSNHTSKTAEKKAERKYKNFTDRFSVGLTSFVAVGQAGIAASCFIIAGVAQPWFWPIFFAALISNFVLMSPDIKELLRNVTRAFKFNKDFLDGLKGGRRILAYCSLVFAVASGLAFGFMALGTTYSAFMAILPVLGLGFMAVPGVGWAIAGIVALATIPVLTALMFKGMADFIKDSDANKQAIMQYFSFKGFSQLSGKEKATFLLSRLLQPIIALATVGIVFFAVVATFGSYTSDITHTLNKAFGLSAKIAHGISLFVVFFCNLIPEIVFNVRNVLNFFQQLPNHLMLLFNRFMVVANSDAHPAAKCMVAGIFLLSLLTLGIVGLNGYGNGRTGANPDGDGVSFLRKMFGFSTNVATVIALITSAGISIAANETYAMEELNHHTPVGLGENGQPSPKVAIQLGTTPVLGDAAKTVSPAAKGLKELSVFSKSQEKVDAAHLSSGMSPVAVEI